MVPPRALTTLRGGEKYLQKDQVHREKHIVICLVVDKQRKKLLDKYIDHTKRELSQRGSSQHPFVFQSQPFLELEEPELTVYGAKSQIKQIALASRYKGICCPCQAAK